MPRAQVSPCSPIAPIRPPKVHELVPNISRSGPRCPSLTQRRDVAPALVHDGTQLRQLPERPVALQHEAKRARVCQVLERQLIVQRCLQRVRKAAECRVACVEGRLAARAGEAQRVARHRLPAHHQEKTCEDITPYGVITQFPKNGSLFTPKYRFITPSTFDHTEKNLFTLSIFKITPS